MDIGIEKKTHYIYIYNLRLTSSLCLLEMKNYISITTLANATL